MALLTILGNWSAFLRPLIYLNMQNQWTLSLGLMGFLGEHSAAWGPVMAASATFILPLIALFFFT